MASTTSISGVSLLGGYPTQSVPTSSAPLSRAAKRAQQEWQQLRETPEEDFEAKPIEEDRLLSWEVLIHGPKDTPYEGGTYCLDLELSESYPFKAPQFSFLTPIYHCNLSLAVAPKRCSAEALLRASENWHPKIDIRTVLRKIHTLMKEPVSSTGLSADALEELKSDTSKIRLENSLIDPEMALVHCLEPTKYQAKAFETTQAFFAPVEVLPEAEEEPKKYQAKAFEATQEGQASSSAAAASSSSQAAPDRKDIFAEPCVAQATSIEDVRLPCPICGIWYTSAILGIHLEGHFAFEASSKLSAQFEDSSCAAASSSSQAAAAASSSSAAAASSSAAAASSSSSSAAAAAAAPADPTEATPESDEFDDWENLGADENAYLLVDSEDVFVEEEELEDESQVGEASHPGGEEEVESDAAMAARLQQEELDRTLETFSQLAADRLEALRLDESGLGAQAKAAQQVAIDQQRKRTKTTKAARTKVPQAKPVAKPKPRPVAPAPVAVAPTRVPGRPITTIRNEFGTNRHPSTVEGKLMQHLRDAGHREVLRQSSEEFALVKTHFMASLGASGVSIHSIESVSPTCKLASSGAFRLMFHGCKCIQNEVAILKNGFQVSKCISGGHRYGTWFAFNAAYSDAGFAFNDTEGWRHMFVCVVSNAGIVMENQTMRVVGQGYAYPRWIVKYRHGASASLHTFNVGPYGRWAAGAGANNAQPAQGGLSNSRAMVMAAAPWGYEVKDGQWVPLTSPPKR